MEDSILMIAPLATEAFFHVFGVGLPAEFSLGGGEFVFVLTRIDSQGIVTTVLVCRHEPTGGDNPEITDGL